MSACSLKQFDMRILAITVLLVVAQSCAAGQYDLRMRQMSLDHSRELLGYMHKNSDDIYNTIMRGESGSTELLSQVVGAALTAQTQAWFRCSRKFGVNREVFAENIASYTAFKNEKELCAKSCYMEESGMVADGKLNQDMVSLIMIMGYGDDKDIHDYGKALTNKCNDEIAKTEPETCKSAMYLDCYIKGLQKANIYMPGQILQEFTSPWIMELPSK